jgi:hypothetical protein
MGGSFQLYQYQTIRIYADLLFSFQTQGDLGYVRSLTSQAHQELGRKQDARMHENSDENFLTP